VTWASVLKERIVKLLVADVVLSPDGLLVRLRLNGLNALVAELQGDGPVELTKDGQTADIRVPMEFKRRGRRKEIVLPPDAATTADIGPRRPIVVALARAYKWQKMLEEGEAGSMAELADRYGVDRSYVGRTLKLAALAPSIVEAIFSGEEPSSLSLMELHRPLPLRWGEQCRMLAFPVDGE